MLPLVYEAHLLMTDTRLDRTKLRTKQCLWGDFKMQTVAMGWCQSCPRAFVP